ncbi:hypothetical protein J6R97_07470 [bacterium]|nr:hypothetical protein [bacterium]
MKKVLFVALFAIFLLCGCKYDRGIILFNKELITKDNVLHNSKVFSVGERIYYLFIAPKKMDNGYIRVQIFKMTDKAPWGEYEVKRTKDFRLMRDEKYYHTDYFVLHETGRYVMQVFSMDDLQHPLSIEDFYVK